MLDPRDLEKSRAWTCFWDEQGDGSHCLAAAPPDLRRSLEEHWQVFAVALSAGAKVLDIGCGAGAVGQALVAVAPKLQVTGIDFAGIRGAKNEQVKLLPNVSMEALPFADGIFDAAVSQFGFEYGRTGEAAAEMARVLKPGAPFSLLVHHSQSPIMTDLPSHKRALEGLCSASLQAAFLEGNAAALQREISVLQQRSPGLGIIGQAARGLHANIGRSETQRAEVWEAVVDALRPDCILIRSQEESCVAPDGLDRWLRPLSGAFDIAPASVLLFRKGVPIAWKLDGRRKPAVDGNRPAMRHLAGAGCLHPLILAMTGACPNYPKSKPPSEASNAY